MTTLTLPGFYLKNKDWAEEIAGQLGDNIPTKILYYRHWETGNPRDFDLEHEVEKALRLIAAGQANVIAKSIGTLITMYILKKLPQQIERVILCGIPLNDFSAEDKKQFMVLVNFPIEKILIFQNEQDPHGTYPQAKEFLGAINPQINIVSKPRDDHEYPYPEEFRNFLLSS